MTNFRIKKLCLFFLPALLIACEGTPKQEIVSASPVTTDTSTSHTIDSLSEQNPNEPMAEKVSITGDFDGDGQKEEAWAVRTKEAEGNPVEDGTPQEYTIYFSNVHIPAIPIGCCEVRLMNEGDLNMDGKDELSVFQAPMNGNTFVLSTYAHLQGKWKQVIKPLLIPVIEQEISEEELQKRIFRENDSIYVYKVDENDENLRLVKKSIALY